MQQSGQLELSKENGLKPPQKVRVSVGRGFHHPAELRTLSRQCSEIIQSGESV